jgi:hypothetical protein
LEAFIIYKGELKLMKLYEEFKEYENLWEELNSFCWFGKYFDMHGDKKLVYISKELTRDADEADSIIQDNIPEPYTKFIFGGTVSRTTAEQEGWTEIIL